jgi:F-type H+-transporting ATPase subunit b
MAQSSAQPVTSTEHAPAGEHGSKFPPFDSTYFAAQLVWLALTFGALYLLMSRIALPRIGSILEARRRRISDDLAQSDQLGAKSQAVLAAHEQALSDAKGRAQILENEARQSASAAAEARRKELDASLNVHIAEAEKSIAASRASAMSNVRGIAGEAAGAIVERLTGLRASDHEIAEALKAPHDGQPNV